MQKPRRRLEFPLSATTSLNFDAHQQSRPKPTAFSYHLRGSAVGECISVVWNFRVAAPPPYAGLRHHTVWEEQNKRQDGQFGSCSPVSVPTLFTKRSLSPTFHAPWDLGSGWPNHSIWLSDLGGEIEKKGGQQQK